MRILTLSVSECLRSVGVGFLLLAMFAVPAHAAASHTWTGATNQLWTTPTNWLGNVAPVAGDDLIFPDGVANTTVTNNFAPGTTFRSININGAYIMSGNPIVLNLGMNVVSAGTTYAIPTTLGASQTWDVLGESSILNTLGQVTLAGNNLTLTVRGDSHLNMSGIISGFGNVTKTESGTLSLFAGNTYSGLTTVAGGVLEVQNNKSLGLGDGTAGNGTIVNDGASIALFSVAVVNEALTLNGAGHLGLGALQAAGGNSQLTGPITLASPHVLMNLDAVTGLNVLGVVSGPGELDVTGDGFLELARSENSFTGGVNLHPGIADTTALAVNADQALPGDPVLDLSAGNLFIVDTLHQTVKGLTGAGSVNMPLASNPTLMLDGPGDTVFSGAVNGTGTFVHSGTGHQTFSGANTCNCGLDVQHGIVSIFGGNGRWAGPIFVEGDGAISLYGGGHTQGINVVNGHLQISESAGAIGFSGTVAMTSATFDVSGNSALRSLGELHVTGTVTITNSTLALHLPAGFDADVNTAFTIIDNDGADAVSGTFTRLPEGAMLPIGRFTFQISYRGGSGNDVVLTLVDKAPIARDYLLTEGADSSFFTTDILLANPNDQPAPIHITFLKEDGTTVTKDDTLSAMSHKFLRVNTVAGMESTAFSTLVSSLSGLPLVVERTMSWDQTGYGAHTEHATDGAANTWYFAEGSQGFFHTYLLLANPQATANTATVQYLIEGGTPVTRTYPLAATSRFTVDVGADAALVNQSFGMIVTFAQPGAAERAMYFGNVPLFNGGHESAGVNAPSTTWFLAEGATGPFFETFVLLANPGDTDATATLTYFPLDGTPITATKPVPAHARVTVNLEGEDPALSNAAVSTQVVSTQPLLVERSQYWPDPAPNWY